MTISPRPDDSPRRSGSLLLEMGIVIVLAFAFLVILIPQFLRARTVARRTQCLNNLKNVALALQNYSEVHECYPPGYIVRGVESHDSALVEHGPGWGWGVMVLPHLDQQPMYSMFDFSRDLAGGATMIQTYLCPDGAGAVFTVSSTDAGMVTLAPANFVGVAGRGSLTEEPGRPAFPGMLYRNSSVRQDDVPDGISNTLLLGERRSVWDGPQGGLIDTSSTWLGAPSGAFRDPGYLDEPRLEGPGSLVLGVVGQTRPISLKLSPNCAPAGIGFTSGHEDRVHFARVDGSCSTISPQIDAEVFVRLGQRSDGEPTGER